MTDIGSKERNQDRFWDQATTKDYSTDDGFKAIFSHTKGGSSTAWQNREVVISLETSFADGAKELRELVAGFIQTVTTSRNSELATIKITSFSKPMEKAKAERVKDGGQWYENQNMSYVINRLMEQVFKDNSGRLPFNKTVIKELLEVKTLDGQLGWWNLGVPPGWDGETLIPSVTATPLTAMCTNEDRTKIYCGLGGVDGTNSAELWEYDIDENLWTLKGTAGASPATNQKYAPIQKLWLNTTDGLIYGVMWKDYGDDEDTAEDYLNKINWIAPSARMFWWDPSSEPSYSFLDDSSHSSDMGNMFPGEWDVREMYMVDSSTETGRKKNTGSSPTCQGADYNTSQTYKQDYRASVGNYTSFKYVAVPLGPVGQQGDPSTGAQEPRRAATRYHPKPEDDYANDPLMQVWGNTSYGTPKGELIPTTPANGNTLWTGAAGVTPPTGFVKSGSPTFSVTGGVMTMTHGGNLTYGLNLTIADVEDNMTVYRLRIDGTQNWEIAVSNTSGAFSGNSFPYGPEGPVNAEPYSNIKYGDGDYFFSVLTSNSLPGHSNNKNIYLAVRPRSGSDDLIINNISLTVARHWDRIQDLDRQAGDNIPITNYSKIVAGVSVRWPTSPKAGELGPQAGPQGGAYTTDRGPGWELYDYDPDVSGASRNEVPLAAEGTVRNEEIILEFNMIAQDRRELTGWASAAYHPMYGPSDAEDGMPPDNSKRFTIGGKNIRPDPDFYDENSFANEVKIVDMAPNRYRTTGPQAWAIGDQHLDANPYHMQGGRGGHGYASIHAQAIGARAMDGSISDNYEIGGMIRFTNGQQGFCVFSQEADSGKGVIMFCFYDGVDPNDNYSFLWGPGGSGRFQVNYKVFTCDDHAFSTWDQGATNGNGRVPTRTALATQAPLRSAAGDSWVPVYPTAGCVDDAGNVYIAAIESQCQTERFTGSNEADIRSKSYIYKIVLGTGTYTKAGSTVSVLYNSSVDGSVYNVDGVGGCFGNLSDDWNGETGDTGPEDNSRKFQWLFFNPYETTYKLFGSCFRRESVLAAPNTLPNLPIPCHEVFTFDGVSFNELTIIDNDVSDGENTDAVGFFGFFASNGEIAIEQLAVGENPATWYFRQKKAVPAQASFENTGNGLQLNYAYDLSGDLIGGEWWDAATNGEDSKRIHYDEGFLGHQQAVAALVNVGLEVQREAVFGSFDHWISHYHLSEQGRADLKYGSSRFFWKLDDREIDPRLEVYDFSGLTVFDAVSKLARAFNFVFGFESDKFFLVARDLKETTHTLNWDDGNIVDITKEVKDDIKNVISIAPYFPILEDVEWEVTHVGTDDSLSNDLSLFNGEFTMNVETHKATSMNLICTRQSRLVMGAYRDLATDAVPEPATIGNDYLMDAINDCEDRLSVCFKWKTNAPTKSVTLMADISGTSTIIYLNTTYTGGNDPVVKGDILVFTDPVTYAMIGRVITEVDTINHTVVIEGGTGFSVNKFIPLSIASAHVGRNYDADRNIELEGYGNVWSDDGVAIIQAVDHTATIKNENGVDVTVTRLTVNNVAPFRGFNFRPYNSQSYRHYSFLVTTATSTVFSQKTLPPGAPGSIHNDDLAWIFTVNTDFNYIYLNGKYEAFEVGDVLRSHYVLGPASLVIGVENSELAPPPYQSVIQDIPNGYGSWQWAADNVNDKFNIGDIIQLHFAGIKLTKDDGAIYTGADITSIRKYGERPWTVPDNRFMAHSRAEHWVSKYLMEYSHPHYGIKITTDYDPTLSFMNSANKKLRKLSIVDPVMFKGFAGFEVSGPLTEITLNMAKFTMNLSFITDEEY